MGKESSKRWYKHMKLKTTNIRELQKFETFLGRSMVNEKRPGRKVIEKMRNINR